MCEHVLGLLCSTAWHANSQGCVSGNVCAFSSWSLPLTIFHIKTNTFISTGEKGIRETFMDTRAFYGYRRKSTPHKWLPQLCVLIWHALFQLKNMSPFFSGYYFSWDPQYAPDEPYKLKNSSVTGPIMASVIQRKIPTSASSVICVRELQ